MIMRASSGTTNLNKISGTNDIKWTVEMYEGYKNLVINSSNLLESAASLGNMKFIRFTFFIVSL